ncbi:MAG: hypothetical protein WC554_14210 [Clostridia bacterium]
MKTSYFKYYTGDDGVAVCLYPPIDWGGLQFPALAPSRDIFYAIKSGKIDETEYERRFREEILIRLDPQQIYNMFKNNVLLCWENPEKFCHRKIISQWIFENLKIEVPEWKKKDQFKKVKNVNPLF